MENFIYQRETTSKFVVSYWHIPGGANYSNATVMTAFTNTKEQAENLANYLGRMPPEMADVTSIEVYDRHAAKAKKL